MYFHTFYWIGPEDKRDGNFALKISIRCKKKEEEALQGGGRGIKKGTTYSLSNFLTYVYMSGQRVSK